MPHHPFIFNALLALEGLHIFECVGPFERVEDPVEVPAQGAREGLGFHCGAGDGTPGGPAPDGGGPAAVVRHADLRTTQQSCYVILCWIG